MLRRVIALVSLVFALGMWSGAARADKTLLNVSYDPTRELYAEVNTAFAAAWKKQHNETLTLQLSNNGSGAQARAVIDGLEADVVTLALAQDVDAIAQQSKLLPADWQKRLPDNSAPYTSTIVLLVRKGNPKHIQDWNDLIRPDVKIITPNPKTSGGARWNYLAAWGYALKANGGDEAKAKDFITRLFKNVPVLDTGARGATNSFVQRHLGDVLIAWENEALLAVNELGKDKFEIIIPSLSILTEPTVAVVDANAKKHGTAEAAEAYLRFLYAPEGQEIIAKHYFRPRSAEVAARHTEFSKVNLITIDDFGGWAKAQATHFADGGIFDQVYTPGR